MTPAYRFELAEATPSNNAIRNMHYMQYKRMRMKWRERLLQQLQLQGIKLPEAPVAPAIVVVDRFSAGALDWDNAYGGLKPLLDCLVQPSRQNPDGLGLIANDNVSGLPMPPLLRQLKADRGKGRTVLSVYGFSADQAARLAAELFKD